LSVVGKTILAYDGTKRSAPRIDAAYFSKNKSNPLESNVEKFSSSEQFKEVLDIPIIRIEN
jgi:hypothetical protein